MAGGALGGILLRDCEVGRPPVGVVIERTDPRMAGRAGLLLMASAASSGCLSGCGAMGSHPVCVMTGGFYTLVAILAEGRVMALVAEGSIALSSNGMYLLPIVRMRHLDTMTLLAASCLVTCNTGRRVNRRRSSVQLAPIARQVRCRLVRLMTRHTEIALMAC